MEGQRGKGVILKSRWWKCGLWTTQKIPNYKIENDAEGKLCLPIYVMPQSQSQSLSASTSTLLS